MLLMGESINGTRKQVAAAWRSRDSGRRRQPVGRESAPLARAALGGDPRAVAPSLRDAPVFDDLDVRSSPEEQTKALEKPVARGAGDHERVGGGVGLRIHGA